MYGAESSTVRILSRSFESAHHGADKPAARPAHSRELPSPPTLARPTRSAHARSVHVRSSRMRSAHARLAHTLWAHARTAHTRAVHACSDDRLRGRAPTDEGVEDGGRDGGGRQTVAGTTKVCLMAEADESVLDGRSRDGDRDGGHGKEAHRPVAHSNAVSAHSA